MDPIDEIVDEYKTRYTLSTIDKLNWRLRIEQQLWMCVQAKGKYGFFHIEVQKLEDCLCTNFYGLDLRSPMLSFIYNLNETVSKSISDRLKKYHYNPKDLNDLIASDKAKLFRKIYFQYWQYRFEFARDILAEHRGLLWGTPKLPSGQQMPDE